MRVSRRFGSLAAIAVILAGASVAVCLVNRHGPSGIVSVAPDRDDSLVYVDGAFLGTAGSKEPLEMRLAPGAHDFRLSCQGSPDLFGRIDVVADKKMSVAATYAKLESPFDPPSTPQPIGLGQTLRLALKPTKKGAEPSKWSFRLPGKKGERVLLVVADRKDPINLAIVDEGTQASVSYAKVTETDGLDGKEYGEFTHASDGASILTIWSMGTKNVNPLVLRVCKAPPPMLKNSTKVGRREPPAELKK